MAPLKPRSNGSSAVDESRLVSVNDIKCRPYLILKSVSHCFQISYRDTVIAAGISTLKMIIYNSTEDD